MTPPPLPIPSFLDRPPGSDPEVRGWVVTAQETIAALDAELHAARARAEAAERRLTEVRTWAPAVGLAAGTRLVDERAEVGSPVGEAQARFQAATEAAATVLNEARAVLREARDGPQQGLTAPGAPPSTGLTPTGTPPGSAESSAQAFLAPHPSESVAPAPAAPPRPPAPAPGTPVPAAAPRPPAPAPATPAPAVASPPEPRPVAADRHIASRPANLGYDPSVVLPPRAPSRQSRPGLGRLFGRSSRRP